VARWPLPHVSAAIYDSVLLGKVPQDVATGILRMAEKRRQV
jgi:hypothetical protein